MVCNHLILWRIRKIWSAVLSFIVLSSTGWLMVLKGCSGCGLLVYYMGGMHLLYLPMWYDSCKLHGLPFDNLFIKSLIMSRSSWCCYKLLWLIFADLWGKCQSVGNRVISLQIYVLKWGCYNTLAGCHMCQRDFCGDATCIPLITSVYFETTFPIKRVGIVYSGQIWIWLPHYILMCLT